MRRVLLVLFAPALLGLAGCAGSSGSQNGPAAVLILAAASTKDAVKEVAAAFSREQGVEVAISAGASSRLATQVVNDAPADLFLSASPQWADHVREKGLARDSTPLLGNRLVLVVPRGNPARVRTPPDLLGPGVKRLALAGPAVPAGTYARQALRSLSLLDPLEQGRRIVVGEDVRVTLAYVERGEADAGIVYATDVRVSAGVEEVHVFAADTHDPIHYHLVLLGRAGGREGPRRLYDYLRSPAAAAVFRRHGFTPLAGQ